MNLYLSKAEVRTMQRLRNAMLMTGMTYDEADKYARESAEHWAKVHDAEKAFKAMRAQGRCEAGR